MASSTLTWRKSEGAKTGTAIGDLISDVVAAFSAVAANADYKWQVASSNSASTPYYVVLKRKNGDPGRVLIVCWTSNPAGNNSTLLDGNPSTSTVQMAYFPNGNTDSPSNLTAASGTIMGDDTGATKVIPVGPALGTLYGANIYPVVWDSEEAVHITFQSSTGSAAYWLAAGAIYVDGDDEAIEGVASSDQSLNNFGANTMAPSFSTSLPTAGGAVSSTANECHRAIIGGLQEICYFAYSIIGNWNGASSNNPMLDTGTSRAWFAPIHVLRRSVGAGVSLKLRQFGYGPPTSAAFAEYNTAGLTPAAINSQGNSSGGSAPWFCNFKI